MFKFYRSVLAAGVVAFGLSACGDDVTVAGGGTTTRGVTSVSVTPQNAQVGIGQTIQLAPQVTADSGVATTVTWTSSTPTIASVDANSGLISGVSLGTTTVIATSTADPTKTAAAQVTVIAAIPGITSFTITPTSLALAPGQSSTLVPNIVTAPGFTAPAVTWTSLTPAVATVSSSGVVTAVATGNAVVTGAITASGNTITQAVAVTVGQGASISLASITGANGDDVDLSNVTGQVSVNMNLNANGVPLDSLNVYIQENGVSRRLATQSYGNTVPSTGPVTLLVNTANFTKNKTTGNATVDIFNGPGTFVVRLFPHGTPGGSVTNCQVGANDPLCSHPQSLVFNNADGFAADNIKPARSASDSGGNGNATGQTFWGGPGVQGADSAILYPIIYDSLGNGRTITNVTWGIGSTIASCDVTHTFTAGAYNGHNVFASGVTGDSDCTTHQNITHLRDNVIVLSATDNMGNPFPNSGTHHLIANTIVSGATPDSIRIDYAGPSNVQRPAGEGWEGQHWVNATWAFNQFGTEIDDDGVGPAPSTWAAFIGSGSTFTTSVVTGATLAETNTNTTDGYTARATGADRLGNTSNSAVTTTFGVDKTAPSLRISTVASPSSFASSYLGGGAATVLDSTTYDAFQGLYGTNVTTAGAQDLFVGAAAGTNDSLRVEGTDNRSGLFRGIETVNDFAQGGATGTTTSVTAATVNFTILDGISTTSGFLPSTADGWLPLHAQGVTGGSTTPGYYTSTMYTVDKAGNASGCPVTRATNSANGSACTAAPASSSNLFARRTLAIDPGQPQVTGVSPNNSYVGNQSVVFTLGSQNDLEVIDAKLRLLYPNLTEGDNAGTIPAAGAGGLVWTYALSNTLLGSGFSAGPASGNGTNFGYFAPIAMRFDNSIINPSTTPLTLDLFTTNIQETCTGTTGTATGPTTATACGTGSTPAVGDPIPTTVAAGGIVHAIPTNVGVQVRDVFGSWIFNSTASGVTGVSAEFVSPILSATVDTSKIANTSYSVTYTSPGSSSSCPQGGAVQPAGTVSCVTAGINFRADNNLTSGNTKVFRATEALSRSLPTFTRVDLFGLNTQNQWVFLARITVPTPVSVGASCPASTPTATGVVGCDNGLERYWLYTFTGTPAGFSEYRAIGVNANASGLASTVHN